MTNSAEYALACDRAYKNGWMQAYREWSDILLAVDVPMTEMDRMDKRRQEMEGYDKQ